MSMIMIIVSFFAGFFLIFAINYALADVAEAHRQQARRRLEMELRSRHKMQARATLADTELYQAAAEGRVEIQRGKSLEKKLKDLLIQSGVAMRLDQLLVACASVGLVAFLPGALIWQNWLLSIALGLIAAPLPLAYISFVRARRRATILQQLPGAFDLMARTLRSGQTISQSFQCVADEAPAPICEEFSFCYEQQNLGLSPEAAMRDLARRTGLLELKIFVMAVMIHRQTGGNMSELLDKLGQVIRARVRIRGAVKALTAEGMMQAYVLLALPPGMLLIMWVMNPGYVGILFVHYWLLIGAGVLMLIGALFMRRIVNFDI
jgi:tight adherence protein B